MRLSVLVSRGLVMPGNMLAMTAPAAPVRQDNCLVSCMETAERCSPTPTSTSSLSQCLSSLRYSSRSICQETHRDKTLCCGSATCAVTVALLKRGGIGPLSRLVFGNDLLTAPSSDQVSGPTVSELLSTSSFNLNTCTLVHAMVESSTEHESR